MKNHKRDRVSMMYASLFCAIAFLANAFALSGCVDLNKAEFESAIVLSESLNTVVRAYYNLDSDDAIKPEMLDNITSIAVSTYEWDDRLYYEYTVNHNYDMTVSALPKMVRANYFENVILPTLEEKGSGVSYYRFQAFYSLLDLNAEDLDEREREELIAEYPIITEADAFYLLDPYVSDRETALLRSNIYDAKLDEPFLLDPRGIDRETLGYFKNLSEIIYVE